MHPTIESVEVYIVDKSNQALYLEFHNIYLVIHFLLMMRQLVELSYFCLYAFYHRL
jgi:hypothetical protein